MSALRRAVVLAVAAVAGLGFARSVGAVPASGVRFPSEYRTWTVESRTGDKRTISQFFVPVIVTVQKDRETNFVVSMAGAGSTLDPEAAGSETLGGATNLKVQGFHRLRGTGLMLTGALELPTGKTGLTQEQLQVMTALSHPVLGMRLKQYGAGWNLRGGVSWAKPMARSLKLGLGAGFLAPGSYELVRNAGDYSPTPEVALSAGLELIDTARPDAKQDAGLQTTYRVFAKDQLNGVDIFEEGNQLEILGTGTNRFGTVNATLLAEVVLKEENTSFAPEGDALRAIKLSSGTGVLARLILTKPVSDRVQLGIDSDVKSFTGSDIPEENGLAFSLGPTFGVAVGEGNWLWARIVYLTGKLGEDDRKLDASGFSGSLNFVWRPGF